MQKNISTQEFEKSLRQIVDAVTRGDRFVIEDEGRPIAALVPLQWDNDKQRSRDFIFNFMESAANANRDLDPELIESTIAEAVEEVRRERREKQH